MVDVDALLSYLVGEEYNHALALWAPGHYDLGSAVNWFLLETLDGMTADSGFFPGLRSYTIDLANAVIDEITQQRLPNHEPIRYHYEGRGYGGSIRIRQADDFD
jgi:hypothetical protein